MDVQQFMNGIVNEALLYQKNRKSRSVAIIGLTFAVARAVPRAGSSLS